MSTPGTRRAGFTLIELLVVISLIATLAALSTGAFFRVRAGQQKSASEATLTKLNTALDTRWKAIEESVNEDARKNQGQWANALTMAGGNPDIAKSLLLYAKVKNELPMTFAEARNATVVGSIVLPARANFLGLPAVGPGTPEETAVCIYLAITTSGGGGTMTEGDGLQQQIMDAPTITGFKVFKDAWGMPLAYVRHAYTPEIRASPYVRTGKEIDPFDPAGRLTAFFASNPAIWTNIVGNTPGFAAIPGAYPGAVNHVPTLISAGANRNFEASIFAGSNNDNLLSYRLRREGNRGD